MEEKRSVRFKGRSTTIRLETPFWRVLDKIADDRGIAISALLESIDGACNIEPDKSPGAKNLASCLRVYCLNKQVSKGGENDQVSF